MKHGILIIVLAILLSACGNSKHQTKGALRPVPADSAVHLHKLNKLRITGNFNRDGLRNTLVQHAWSGKRKQEIDSSADPLQYDWDEVSDWFYHQETDVYLHLDQSGSDTLHLGPAQGLYCLINIGDNNHDGRDEIALVVDRLDHSRLNKCEIYSLCNGAWRKLAEFDIHESAFDYTGGAPVVFEAIPGFLQKTSGHWVYSDYSQNGYENQEDVGRMTRLEIGPCGNSR